MKRLNKETGDIVLICRGSDGKISRHIKIGGLLDEISDIKKKLDSQGETLDVVIARWEEEFHTCLISKLIFLYSGLDRENVETVTESEKCNLIPLAAELTENLVFVYESLRNHKQFSNERDRLDFLRKYKT